MVEAGVPVMAEAKATHFSREGKLLVNPPKEAPAKAEPRLLKIIDRLRAKELPQKPEGPKHVLEAIQEIGLDKKASDSITKINDQAKLCGGARGAPDLFEDRLGLGVKVASIPGVEMPAQVNAILGRFQKQNGEQDIVSSMVLTKSSVEFRSRDGIIIQLILPTEEKAVDRPNENSMSLRVWTATNKVQTESDASALMVIQEQYQNRQSLMDIAGSIVSTVEVVADKLPPIVSEAIEKQAKIRRAEKEREDWLVKPNSIAKIKKTIDSGRQDARELPTTPDELAERLKDPKYLPQRDEIVSAFKDKTPDEFADFCEKNSIFEFFNEESVNTLSDYLVNRIFAYQNGIKTGELRPIKILEVGAGNGRLTYFIEQRLRALGLRPDQVVLSASDDNSWNLDEGNSPIVVDNIPAKESVAKNQPDIVIFSWMPPNTDLSPDLRQPGVQEYILVGDMGGVCGTSETMVDEVDGFHQVVLSPTSDSDGVVRGQIGKSDNRFDSSHSGTYSFRKG